MTAEIVGKVRRADMPAYKVKMYDGCVSYYVGAHPHAAPGDEEKYLTHKDVIVLAGEPRS